MLLVRSMRTHDIPAVVNLLARTSPAHHPTKATGDADRRHVCHQVVDQATRTGDVQIAVRGTGTRSATAGTLLGVAVLLAVSGKATATSPVCGGVEVSAHVLLPLRRRHRRRQPGDISLYVLAHLALREGASYDDVGAALLSVVQTRLLVHGCYAPVYDDDACPVYQRLGYTDIGGPRHTPQGRPVRHLWRGPGATDPPRASATGASRRPCARDTWTSPDVKAQVYRLYDAHGWTSGAIAAYLGCHVTIVRALLREHRGSPAVTPDMARRYQQGHLTIGGIASQLRCSFNTATDLLRAAGATVPDDETLDRDIVERYTQLGQPLRQIAADLTLSYTFVRDRLLSAGVELRQHGGRRQRHRTSPTPDAGPPQRAPPVPHLAAGLLPGRCRPATARWHAGPTTLPRSTPAYLTLASPYQCRGHCPQTRPPTPPTVLPVPPEGPTAHDHQCCTRSAPPTRRRHCRRRPDRGDSLRRRHRIRQGRRRRPPCPTCARSGWTGGSSVDRCRGHRPYRTRR